MRRPTTVASPGDATTWGAVAAGVAGVAGAALSSSASSRAARQQQAAARDATALQRQQYEETVARNAPYYEAGTGALATLQGRLPELTRGYDPQQLLQDPGYLFGMQQGMGNLQNTAAAQGGLYSGNALKALQRYGTDYATTKLNDAFSRQMQGNQQAYNMLSGLANQGQQAATNTSAYGSQFGSQAAGNMMGAANVGAANSLNQANIWGNALNQGVSAYRGYQGGAGGTADRSSFRYDDPYRNPNYYGGDYGEADGGPILLANGGAVEGLPPLGAPPPRRNVLEILLGLNRPVPAVPAAPVVVPAEQRGILTLGARRTKQLEEAERKALGMEGGGPVPAGEGGRTDTIPARLSSGEHILDAELVSMLGDGDNIAGQRMLEEFKQRIRATKRAYPPDMPAR